MIVFFGKARITGLPLQNKLRTYTKRRRNQRQSFFQSVGPEPPPPPIAKPDENFLGPRMDIRYRGGIETTSLLKPFYSADKIEIKTVGWHILQSGVVLKTV